MRLGSVTTWLILINVAVYVLDSLLGRAGYRYHLLTPFGYFPRPPDYFTPMEAWGFFSTATAIYGGQVWRFLTFQFLHAHPLHLMMNMLSLYFFGPLVEEYLGHKRFIAFYLVCGVGGAVSYLALWVTGFLVGFAWIPLVGASAGIFGILMAAAVVAPDARVMLIFPPIPMRLKTMALALLGIAAYTILTQGRNAGGEAAHLGGAVIGFILISRPWRLLTHRKPPPEQRWA